MILEGDRQGEFILTPANGSISYDDATIVMAGARLPSGQILGKVTASGKYRPHNAANNDGSQTAVAVLVTPLASATGDVRAAIVSRDCEVKAYRLTPVPAKASLIETQLAAVGIIVRR